MKSAWRNRFAQFAGNDLQHLVPGQVAEVVVDPLEVVDVQHRQQQIAAVPVPARHFLFQALAERRAVGQAGQRIGQGFLSLVLQVAVERLGILLHAVDPLHQRLQAAGHLLFVLGLFALVFVHGGKQAVQPAVHRQLEAVQVGRLLHAGLQATDLLTQRLVEAARVVQHVGIAGVGVAQVAEEAFQALVELPQVFLEVALATVRQGQHQHRQVVEYRHQLIPVQAAIDPLPQRLGLGLVAARQGQAVEQPQQAGLDVRRHRAVAGLRYRRRQFVGLVYRLPVEVIHRGGRSFGRAFNVRRHCGRRLRTRFFQRLAKAQAGR
ncbi:Uncharacterised protein [Pseudomonas aeruginosa]|nr:Uncharacterised protein [Pseudomonas aeruginosa]